MSRSIAIRNRLTALGLAAFIVATAAPSRAEDAAKPDAAADAKKPGDNATLTEWQFDLWRESIADWARQKRWTNSLGDVPDHVRRDPDNKFSSLAAQLNSLRSVGFVHVECLYRNSVFVLYCGQKPSAAPPPHTS